MNDSLSQAPSTGSGAPPVTVLMPMYNTAAYLRPAVESILKQTFAGFELLVVDDGSTDDGADIINSYRDSRIRMLHNTRNLGLGHTLNRGIREARGELIAHMHGDDVARPDRLARQVDFMRRHPEVGVCGGHINKMMNNRASVVRYPLNHDDIWAMTLFYSAFAHPCVMVRRRVHLDHEVFYNNDLNSVEDYDLWTRLLRHTRGANIDAVLLDYRCHDKQLSVTRYQRLMEFCRIIHRGMLAPLLPEISDQALAMHFRAGIPHEQFSIEDLAATERWLMTLREANRSAGQVFGEQALDRMLARCWLHDNKMATQHGVATLQRYLASPLSAGLRLHPEFLRLAVRCVFRMTY